MFVKLSVCGKNKHSLCLNYVYSLCQMHVVLFHQKRQPERKRERERKEKRERRKEKTITVISD